MPQENEDSVQQWLALYVGINVMLGDELRKSLLQKANTVRDRFVSFLEKTPNVDEEARKKELRRLHTQQRNASTMPFDKYDNWMKEPNQIEGFELLKLFVTMDCSHFKLVEDADISLTTAMLQYCNIAMMSSTKPLRSLAELRNELLHLSDASKLQDFDKSSERLLRIADELYHNSWIKCDLKEKMSQLLRLDFADYPAYNPQVRSMQEIEDNLRQESYVSIKELQCLNQRHASQINKLWLCMAVVVVLFAFTHDLQFSLSHGLSNAHRAINLPERFTRYIGREDELLNLSNMLNFSSTKEATLKSVVISGMGGMGKTMLALEFAHRHLNKFPIIWWVDAENLTAFDTVRSLTSLAKQIGHEVLPPGTPAEALVADIFRGLEHPSSHGWLLIVDNAVNTSIFETLPRIGGSILVTTQSSCNKDSGKEIVCLPLLSVLESIHLLRSYAGRDEKDLETLAKRIDGMPLALAQAGSFLKQNPTVTVQSYLTLFEERFENMTRHKGLQRHYRGEQSAWVTFELSLEIISKVAPTALSFLKVAAFFAPDAIPLSYYQLFCKTNTPLEQISLLQELHVLDDYSLIRGSKSGSLIYLHRLVQDFIRRMLTSKEQILSLTTGLDVVGRAHSEHDICYVLPLEDRLADLLFYQLGSIPVANLKRRHFLGLLAIAKIWKCRFSFPSINRFLLSEKHLGQAETLPGRNRLLIANLFQTSGYSLMRESSWQQAKSRLSKALELYTQLTGHASERVETLLDLADHSLRSGGNSEEQYLNEAQTLLRLNPVVKWDIRYRTLLSQSLVKKKQYSAAASAIESALRRSEQFRGVKNVVNAVIYAKMGNIANRMKNANLAQRTFQKALNLINISFIHSKDNGRDTGNDMFDIVHPFSEIAHCQPNAIDLANQIEQILQYHYGKDHIDFVHLFCTFAQEHASKGEFRKGFSLLERADAVYVQTNQTRKPDYAFIRAAIGKFMVPLRMPVDETISVMKDAIERLKSFHGFGVALLNPINDLAVVLINNNKLEEARDYIDQGLKIANEKLPPKYPTTQALSYLQAAIACRTDEGSQNSLCKEIPRQFSLSWVIPCQQD